MNHIILGFEKRADERLEETRSRLERAAKTKEKDPKKSGRIGRLIGSAIGAGLGYASGGKKRYVKAALGGIGGTGAGHVLGKGSAMAKNEERKIGQKYLARKKTGEGEKYLSDYAYGTGRDPDYYK